MSDQAVYFDQLETRSPEERERDLFAALEIQLNNAKSNTNAYGELLKDIDPAEIVDRKSLAGMPLTRKSNLIELQKNEPPFGGFNAVDTGELLRIFISPGPIHEPQGKREDYWRLARSLYAAGFRRGDLVHNTFAYHMTPAGFMMESAAQAIGCCVFAAGTGQTDQQLQSIASLKPKGYNGTPSFLKILLDKADEAGVNIDSLRKALVSGEALPPSLRSDFVDRGIATYQCYATADLGLVAYETPALAGMVIEEEIILEVVTPGTGDPVEEGEVGEIVVTTLNPDYPLIRFATGDLSALLTGRSPCGRTNDRIKGWMGRADQTTKVRGMFVHPSQVAQIQARHPEVRRARLVVDREGAKDIMRLSCEVDTGALEGLSDAIGATIRDVTKLRGEVKLVDINSLPKDGIVIEDVRKYD